MFQDAGGPSTTAETPAATSTTPPQADQGEFYGKSREDVIRELQSLRNRSTEAETNLKHATDFISRVSMFFRQDGDSVSIDSDAMMDYLRMQGKLPKEGDSTPPDNPLTPNPQPDAEHLSLEEAQKKEIERQVQERLKEAMQPMQREFAKHQYGAWVEKLTAKYPDFPSWRAKVGEYINKTGHQVSSMESLEQAFLGAKASAGEFVDKKQYEAHVKDLEKTLQMHMPGSLVAPVDMDNAPTEELLGLNRKSEKQAVVEALFGKPFLNEE